MLVAFSTMDNNKLKIVAGSMRDAFGTTTEVRYPELSNPMACRRDRNSKIPRTFFPEESSNTPTPDQQERAVPWRAPEDRS